MTPTATQLKSICESNPNLPVLFVSDSTNGDVFEFGTHEELSNEFEAYDDISDEDLTTELLTTRDILLNFDFEAYEGEQPKLKL